LLIKEVINIAKNIQKTYALVLGIVLAVIGLWGFFTTSILNLFGVNMYQSVLHLIAAAFGIYSGTKGDGKMYNQSIGWIGVALGVLGFIPWVSGLLLSWFNINTAISVLHIVIGAVSLGVFYKAK
jgi:hypothetical protein